MSRSFSARRPYARQTKAITRRASQDLLNKAGQAPIERPRVEQLEPRKMLFSLTIDSGSQTDDAGNRFEEAYFAYFIPYLLSPEEVGDPDGGDALFEDFNGEDPGQIPPNTQQVTDNDLLIRNVNAQRVAFEAPTDADGDAIDDLTVLRNQMGLAGQQWFIATPTDPAVPNGQRNVHTSVTFTVLNLVNGPAGGNSVSGNGFGLLNGALEIQMLFDGTVQRTYTQADLAALDPNNDGFGNFTLNANGGDIGVFDEIRFVQTATAGQPGVQAADFLIDDIVMIPPSEVFSDIVDSRVFGAYVRITGDVGASVNLTDLYGRDIRQTIQLGKPSDDANFVYGDFDGNGVPEYNDGIGAVTLSGFGDGEGSSLYMTGGTILAFGDGQPPVEAEITEGGFAWDFETLDLIDMFEEDAGYGFFLLPDGELGASGLPENYSRVAIGSPFDRPLNSYNPGGLPINYNPQFPQLLDFDNAGHGIFLLDGSSIGDVNVNAVLTGSSLFNGSVGTFATGVNFGNVSVAGDLEAFVVASDAGVFARDADDIDDGNGDLQGLAHLETNAELIVGRTLREFVVGGRNLMTVIIDGDVNESSVTPNEILVYDEREGILELDPSVDDAEREFLRQARDGYAVLSDFFLPFQNLVPTVSRPVAFADAMFRNDHYLAAEMVNSAGTSVVLRGQTGAFDPVSTGEDASDVFGIAVDGTRDIVLESLSLVSSFDAFIRILDAEGRTVAATSSDIDGTFGTTLRYTPDGPGIYYIAIGHGTTVIDATVDLDYSIFVSGLAPTTLGGYRNALGFGVEDDIRDFASDGERERPVVVLNSGSAGSIRVGTGYVQPDGQYGIATDFVNSLEDTEDDFTQMTGFSFSAPGNLYNISTGGDVGSLSGNSAPNDFTVGGHFGSLYTGLSPDVGTDYLQGDLADFVLTTGGQVGLINVSGAIGTDQDGQAGGLPALVTQPVVITTGTDPDLRGDIGLIRVGSHIAGDTLTIDTSATNGSVVGGLLVSQDAPDFGRDLSVTGNDIGIFNGFDGVNLILGQDSDIRFVDTPNIDLLTGANAFLPIITGETLTLVDDAGGRVEISVTSREVFPLEIGRVYVVPVEGSEGVAIARIEIDSLAGTGVFTGGRTLRIEGEGGQSVQDIISIGRIIIDDADAFSEIRIEGPAQIDVWRIDAPAGLATIRQDTPEGDIVAIDTNSLTTLSIMQGDLGRTQLPAWGPRQIGPELGINDSNNNNETSFVLDATFIEPDWNGQIFRPTTTSNNAAGNAFLDDVGSPFDIYLNGIVVRTGGIQSVEVAGGVGDIISQDPTADINEIIVNEDGLTEDGDFDGIFGVIYSENDIVTIEIGDGLAGPSDSPFARAGIFAVGFINEITDNVANADIAGVISAVGFDPTTQFFTLGINELSLDGGGDIVNAYIATPRFLDEFWSSVAYFNEGVFVSLTNEISVSNGDIFKSEITTGQLNSLTISGGFFDASDLSVLTDVTDVISADGFRNSTVGGDPTEFRLSRILIGQDLERLRVTANGDFSDTILNVTGDVVRSIAARDFIRANIGVSNTINAINLTGSMLASTLTAGQLVALTTTDSIRTSSISIAGPLQNITVGNEINRTDITVSGPDGRIGLISAVNDLSAQITSSGRIATIRSSMGDILGSITTTTERGDVSLVSAFRDLSVNTDIGGNLDTLNVGRNIGDAADPGVILVRGDVGVLDVSDGRIFSDLRVGEDIMMITLGGVTNIPTSAKRADGDIEAFGRIQTVDITGDYDGNIISESGGIGNITITDGSLLGDAAIIARDGGINSVVIVAGHLLGDIFAEQSIGTIRVEASADGVFGDVGINPNLSAGVTSNDANRNQLPPGVVATNAIDGPVIASMRGINRFIVTGGSIFDTTIYAGTNLGLLQVAGNVQSDGQQADDDSVTIAAGDQIQEVNITGGVSDTLFLAGVTSFGSMPIFNIVDPLYTDRPGGVGADADTIKSGRIQSVTIGGNASDVTFSSGMVAGVDGIYGTGDESIVLGFSVVDDLNIAGTRTNVTVSADRKFYTLNGQVITPAIQDATPSLNNAGRNASSADGLIESLAGAFSGGSIDLSNIGTVVDFGTVQTFAWNGTTFTVEALSTDGSANADAARGIVWDASRGRLILANTRLEDGVIVSVVDNDNNPATPLPELIDFDIVSNDEASIGLIQINGNLRGGSDIIVDNYANTIDIDDYEGTGLIAIGVDIATLNVGRFSGGSISANFVESLNFSKSLVVFSGNTPSIDLTGVRSFNVTQNITANVNIDRSVTEIFNVGGIMAQTILRAGGSITNITAAEIDRARISVGNVIGSVNIAGDAFDASIIAGGDLGTDGQIGQSGDSSTIDRTTSGTIGSVNIGGNFFESDIVAGFLRGQDGFFGTDDDSAASGNSSIGNVTIGGTGVGSNVNSESYTIAAAGSLAFVTIGGDEGESVGNFTIDPFSGEPLPIQVTNLAVTQDARSYTATFTFNQEIDASTFNEAFSIREVISEGNFLSLVAPTDGVPGSGDYSIDFDIPNRMVFVTVSRTVTDRDLIDNGDGTFSRPAQPGPGVYRFDIDADVLRARVSQARLDGDGDGFAVVGDDFSIDDIVGDAGDVASTRDIERVDVNGDGSYFVDLYGAISLDQVFDSNRAPDGVPDVNDPFTLRGALGDHSDRNINDFGFGGDIDVYEITLQAGQILQLGQISGAAFQAQRNVYFQPAGNNPPEIVFSQQGSGFNANVFFTNFGFETDFAVPLPVQPSQATDRSDPAAILAKQSGTFYIVIEAGDLPNSTWYTGVDVNDADVEPNQIGNYAFTVEVFDDANSGFSAGSDSGDGTNVVHAPPLSLFSDPSDTVIIGDFTFSRLAGADGVFGNSDDVVTGSTGDDEITSTRSGTRLTNLISSSLGDPGVSGLPGTVESDVDVWHLNNRQAIAPGTAMTITVKLADVGGDLGSTIAENASTFTSLADFNDFTKNVQFALFDTTNSTNIDDGLLVFSPTDFDPRASTPNTIIAENGPNRYGFDANGDFFISFIIPPALNGAVNASGTYAVYLQGAFKSDYEIEVVTQGTGAQQIRSQNVLIETDGGIIDWLTVDGDAVEIGGFDARSLGFSGRVNNVDVNTFILQELITNLNDIFDAAGFDMTFSINPADFEFEEFSSVFLTSDQNPIGLITSSDFGYAERSDPFNTDSEDEAVVFSPDFSTLGYTPTTADLDSFIESITAATGRRVGELVGLRLTDVDFASSPDLFNEGAVQFTPGGLDDYIVPTDGRSIASHLGSLDDTGFYLGQQDAASLLDRILSN
ncbi:MAG: hypothetical protein Phyf2KO_18010 [Phycisphaerales bacterium]